LVYGILTLDTFHLQIVRVNGENCSRVNLDAGEIGGDFFPSLSFLERLASEKRESLLARDRRTKATANESEACTHNNCNNQECKLVIHSKGIFENSRNSF
jgi:hypothetical protein